MIYRLKAVIVKIFSKGTALGRMPDGAGVLFPLWGEVRTAQVGDTFSFIPQKPIQRVTDGIVWFAGKPKFECHADGDTSVPMEERPLALSLLPDHHARHFDAAGNIIIGPRPCELEAQRIRFRNSGAAKHAGG